MATLLVPSGSHINFCPLLRPIWEATVGRDYFSLVGLGLEHGAMDMLGRL